MKSVATHLWSLLLALAATYSTLAVLSFAVFHLPWSVLERLPEAKRDQLISTGMVSANVHPLYRDWLLNFVRTPNMPRDLLYTMDTYLAYGEIIHAQVDDDDSDFMGWPNTIPPHDAGVLFVGDSFTSGASAGTRGSPPAVYARLTGANVYNASNGGYGLGQYVRIIDMLTRGLPENKRFAGRDVVVEVYLGNDLTSDLTVYSQRQKYAKDALSWQLELGPMRVWAKYILSSFGLRPAFAASSGPSGRYSPVPMTCQTPAGLPFAWHPGYQSYLFKENFTGQLPLARRIIADLKALEARGLSIKVVLIPSSLQVLDKDIDWSRVPPGSPMAEELPRIVEALDEVRSVGKDLFTKEGFEVLDVTDILRALPERCTFFQPADTHCTTQGYQAIGEAVAARWPALGRDTATRQ